MKGRRLIIGVTGGIAAYKSAQLVSRLVQEGAEVRVVMTAAAQKFLGPTTMAALSGHPVVGDTFDMQSHPLGPHIELASDAQLLCIAPASADFLAKAALGLADDLLSTLYLCFSGPVIMAPAMNDEMWRQPAVQRNLAQLQEDGVHVVGPNAGWLSCRRESVGRMSEPDEILQQIARVLEASVHS